MQANSDTPPPLLNAAQFFTDVVEPTVQEFHHDPGSLRRGCLAALMLAHMAEHLFHAEPRSDQSRKQLEAFKAAIVSDNWYVGVLFEVANATKHVVRHDPKLLGFDGLRVTHTQAGMARCGMNIGGPYVFVEAKKGEFWQLHQLTSPALTFWRSRLEMNAVQTLVTSGG